MTTRRYTEDQLSAIWESTFWTAVGCGHSEAQAGRIADRKLAALRA